jgi:predicted molibdopterin-dependent oxidoreductase YjgC
MTDQITLRINNQFIAVAPGTTVAAAILQVGITTFRRSPTGEPRGPLCGMGICFECRATINGQPHTRTCQLPAQNAMEVRTDDAL